MGAIRLGPKLNKGTAKCYVKTCGAVSCLIDCYTISMYFETNATVFRFYAALCDGQLPTVRDVDFSFFLSWIQLIPSYLADLIG